MKKMLMTLALALVVGTATVVRGGEALTKDKYSITPVDNKSFIFMNKTDKKVGVVVQVNGSDSTVNVDANGVKTITGTFARAEKTV